MAMRKMQAEENVQEASGEVQGEEMGIPKFAVRMYLVNNSRSKLRATASVDIGGMFAAKGFRVFDSYKGPFVKMPSQMYTKGNSKEEREVFFPITKEARDALVGTILEVYHQKMAEEQDSSLMEDGDLSDQDLPFEQVPPPTEEEAPGYGTMEM